MKQLEEFSLELQIIESNIKRVEKFVKENKDEEYSPYSSHVFGELKHRLTALKQTITVVTSMSTGDLF